LSATLKPLVELLKIICDGALPEFMSFASAQKAVFTQHKLDAAALERSVRLLALCSLAAQSSEKALSFAAVQAALQVPAEEVELWVIEAIGERLLEASIDQIAGTVTVKYVRACFGVFSGGDSIISYALRLCRRQFVTLNCCCCHCCVCLTTARLLPVLQPLRAPVLRPRPLAQHPGQAARAAEAGVRRGGDSAAWQDGTYCRHDLG
jgi:hypothetical protein